MKINGFKGKFFTTAPFILSLKFLEKGVSYLTFKFNYNSVYSAILINELLSAIRVFDKTSMVVINNLLGVKENKNSLAITDVILGDKDIKGFTNNLTYSYGVKIPKETDLIILSLMDKSYKIAKIDKILKMIKSPQETFFEKDLVYAEKFAKDSVFDEYIIGINKLPKDVIVTWDYIFSQKGAKDSQIESYLVNTTKLSKQSVLDNYYLVLYRDDEIDAVVDAMEFKAKRYNSVVAKILSEVALVDRILWKFGDVNVHYAGGEREGEKQSILILDEQLANRIIQYTGVLDVVYLLGFIGHDALILNDVLLGYWVNANSNLPFRDAFVLKRDLMQLNDGVEDSVLAKRISEYLSNYMTKFNQTEIEGKFSDTFKAGAKDKKLFGEDFLDYKNTVMKIAQKIKNLYAISLSEIERAQREVKEYGSIVNILFGLEREIDKYGTLDIPKSVLAKTSKYKEAIIELDYQIASKVLEKVGLIKEGKLSEKAPKPSLILKQILSDKAPKLTVLEFVRLALKSYKNAMYFFSDERNMNYTQLQMFSLNTNENMQKVHPKAGWDKRWDKEYDNPLTPNKDIKVDLNSYINDINKVVDPTTGEILIPYMPTDRKNVVRVRSIYDPFNFPKKGKDTPVSVDGFFILRDMIIFLITLWQYYYDKFVGMDARQALKFILTEIYNWIDKYVPERDDYWQVFRLILAFAQGLEDEYCPTYIERHWKPLEINFDDYNFLGGELYNFKIKKFTGGDGTEKILLVSEPITSDDEAVIYYLADIKDENGGTICFDKAILSLPPVPPQPYLEYIDEYPYYYYFDWYPEYFPYGGIVVADFDLVLVDEPAVPSVCTYELENFRSPDLKFDITFYGRFKHFAVDPVNPAQNSGIIGTYPDNYFDGLQVVRYGFPDSVSYIVLKHPFPVKEDGSRDGTVRIRYRRKIENIAGKPIEGEPIKQTFVRTFYPISQDNVTGDFVYNGSGWVSNGVGTTSKNFIININVEEPSKIVLPVVIPSVIVKPSTLINYEWKDVTSERYYENPHGEGWSDPYVKSEESGFKYQWEWKYVEAGQDWSQYGSNLNILQRVFWVPAGTEVYTGVYVSFDYKTKVRVNAWNDSYGYSNWWYEEYPAGTSYQYAPGYAPSSFGVNWQCSDMWVYVPSKRPLYKTKIINGDLRCVTFELKNRGRAHIHIIREGATGTRTNRAYYYIDGKLYSNTAYGNADFVFVTPILDPGIHKFCYKVVATNGRDDGMRMRAYLEKIEEYVPVYSEPVEAVAATVNVYVDGQLVYTFKSKGENNLEWDLIPGNHEIRLEVVPLYSTSDNVFISADKIGFYDYYIEEVLPSGVPKLKFYINDRLVEILAGAKDWSISDWFEVPFNGSTFTARWEFDDLGDETNNCMIYDIEIEVCTLEKPEVKAEGFWGVVVQYVKLGEEGFVFDGEDGVVGIGAGHHHLVYNIPPGRWVRRVYGLGYFNTPLSHIKNFDVKVYKWVYPEPPPSSPPSGTLEFYIDDELVGSWTGKTDFGNVCFNVPYGKHILKWVYRKSSDDNPDEFAYIDNLKIGGGAYDNITWTAECIINSGNAAIEDLIKKLIKYYKDNFGDIFLPPVKTGTVIFKKIPDKQKVHAGETVQYSYYVKNDTDETIVINSIVDDKLGTIVSSTDKIIQLQSLLAIIYPNQYKLVSEDKAVMEASILAEILNVSASWNTEDNIVTIGDKSFTPFSVENGIPYIYVREVAEALGYKVEWESSTKEIKIYKLYNSKEPADASQILKPGESRIFQKSTTIYEDTLNTAKLQYTNSKGTFEETTTAFVKVVTSDLIVEKFVDKEEVAYGEKVTYTFKVRNMGSDVLTNVDIVDDKLGRIDLISTLNPLEERVYTRTVEITKDTHNIVIATGFDTLGQQVQDTAEATVTLKLSKLLKEYVWILT